MNDSIRLSEMVCGYLSEPHKVKLAEMEEHAWFSPENCVAFKQDLETLARASVLGLERQVQQYYSSMSETYEYDLHLKAAYIIRDQLSGDGSLLDGNKVEVTSIDNFDSLLPKEAFTAIERLSEEGFSVENFGVTALAGNNKVTLVMRTGDTWLRVISLNMKDGRKSLKW